MDRHESQYFTKEFMEKHQFTGPNTKVIEHPGWFYIAKGWDKLIWDLVNDLLDLGWDKASFQVKEKFGGLRFYIGGGTAEVMERIHKAEDDSMRTCMECGSTEDVFVAGDGSSWIVAMCLNCRGNSFNPNDYTNQ